MLILKRFAVTAVLTASIALPAPAAAQLQDVRNPDRQAPAVQQQTQDLRNADRRAPDTREITPVDAPAVTTIELPADGFDWGDAGIGAAGGIAVLAMLVGLALAATHRRRDSRITA